MSVGEGARQPQAASAWKRMLYEAVGREVQKRRHAANLSVRTVSERLGMSYNSVARIEAGENASTHFLAAFAQLAGCTLNDLIPTVPVTFNRTIEKADA